jgi:thiol-disulfide isomerase/thioredoxin
MVNSPAALARSQSVFRRSRISFALETGWPVREKSMPKMTALLTMPGSGFTAPLCRRIDLNCHHREAHGMRPNLSSTRSQLAALAVVAIVITCVAFGQKLLTRGLPVVPDRDYGAGPHAMLTSYQGTPLSLRGGVGWINSGPITLNELRGKIVLLDFWTFCCINCHHVLLDLAKLEAKYKDELVVIGVHTAKFPAERDTENIRRKVHEYRIKHPVVNDANMDIWNRFGVNSWPTLVLIDARGNYVDRAMGEGHYDAVDQAIGQLVEHHKARGELNLTPLKFSPEMERPSQGPLLFPGKVLADPAGKRLFIADTGHNRIVRVDLDGGEPVSIGKGEEGFDDGTFKEASFNRPQGMCLDGETLYVADTENHAIRAIELKEGKVTTIAGIGTQAPRPFPPNASGPAKTAPLSSPWDVIQIPGEKALYIAMAGPHQIWKLDLARDTISVFAGSGYEDIQDGTAAMAKFAQPSGLATDGENLFVADSEVSGVRVITGIQGKVPLVRTIVGEGLFKFGDQDGRGSAVRLQHCLGLAYTGGRLYIADTYNNKIKVCDPKSRSVKTLVGVPRPGDSDDPPHFYEPGGLSATEFHLYVADTNNHKIRVVDLKTQAVKTLALEGLSAPRLAVRAPVFPNAKKITAPEAEAAPGQSIALAVMVQLPKGMKINEESPWLYLVETPDKTAILAPELPAEGQKLNPPAKEFKVTVPLAKPAQAGEKLDLRLSLETFVCSETSSLCQVRSYIWNVPITFSDKAPAEPISLTTDMK